MKFKIDKEACQSAGVCLTFTNRGEKIYQFDDKNKAEIITKDGKKVQDQWVDIKEISDQPDRELEKTILDSAKSCPFDAIIVIDDQGKQLWPEAQ